MNLKNLPRRNRIPSQTADLRIIENLSSPARSWSKVSRFAERLLQNTELILYPFNREFEDARFSSLGISSGQTLRMLELRDRRCYLLFCIIVFIISVPCYSHESLLVYLKPSHYPEIINLYIPYWVTIEMMLSIDIYLRFDGKTLYAGKELWKETLPLQSGSRVYKLEGLKSNSWYEVKISYPASVCQICSLVTCFLFSKYFFVCLLNIWSFGMIIDTGSILVATTEEPCDGFEAKSDEKITKHWEVDLRNQKSRRS